MRDNLWLTEKLIFIHQTYFPDITDGNEIEVRFGRASKTRLGSITIREKTAKRTQLDRRKMNYLTADQVGALAQDLAAVSSIQHWVVDIASPGLLQMIQRGFGKVLAEAGAPLHFAPEEGPEFFIEYGWKPVVVYSMLKEAAKVKRLPWLLRLISFLPEPKRPGKRPWSAVCLLSKSPSRL